MIKIDSNHPIAPVENHAPTPFSGRVDHAGLDVVVSELQRKAAWVRAQILEMIATAGKGHIGGSLSCTDILVALYAGGVMHCAPRNPQWAGRDRFILSKGHAVEALYAVLTQAGFLTAATLRGYGTDGSPLGGHPDRFIPGVDVSTGSLGQGLGVGAGLALAARRLQQSHLTFVLLGDGECYEGSVWEGAQFAAHHKLSNLIAIVDRNRQITMDDTEDCNAFEPFADKWRAFGWEVREVDGHSFPALLEAFTDVRERTGDRPLVMIACTRKGRGVSFMEKTVGWHHRVPKGVQLEQARREIARTLAETGQSTP
jgi:transketolase